MRTPMKVRSQAMITLARLNIALVMAITLVMLINFTTIPSSMVVASIHHTQTPIACLYENLPCPWLAKRGVV